MAMCCTNVAVVRSGRSFFSTLPSNGRAQPSPSKLIRCCCTKLSQRRLWGFTKESRAKRLTGSWTQQTSRTESPPSSFCLPTDVSSDATSTEPNVFEGNGSGMSNEEKNAILAFEGVSPDGTREEGNSSEYQQLSSSTEEAEALQGMEQSDGGSDSHRRSKKDETGFKAVKGQGATIANVVNLFMTLLDRRSPGDGKMIAGAGSALLERVEEEVGNLLAVEGVDGQSLYEIRRLVKLLQMDIQLIAATRKESTLSERLVQAKAHCKQILNIVSTLSR